MSKISISSFVDPDLPGQVTAEQMAMVQAGCLETLKRLGQLADYVKLFSVKFEMQGDTKLYGPSFHIVFVDPLGVECSHTTSYRFMGKRDEHGDGSTTPSVEDIADALAGEHKHKLPRFIREHLARGAERLLTVNAQFKRLAADHGYRLQYSEPGGDNYFVSFSAKSDADALQQAAKHLKIPFPMSAQSFRDAYGIAVFRKFTTQFYPRKTN